MRGQDYRDMADDVADVLDDVGTVDGEPTIIWYHRNHDTYDELYKEDVTKSFTEYKMRGLIFNTRPRLAVTQPGLDTTIDTKVMISPKEFARYQLTPSVADRLLVDGVLYNVGGDDKSLVPVRFGGYGVCYMIKVVSAPPAQQPTETAEKNQPYANNTDASGDPLDANTTGVNDEIYDKFPAVAVSTVRSSVVVPTENSSLSLKYNGGIENVITLSSGIFTLGDLASAITDEAQNILGANTFRAVVNTEGYLQLESFDVGPQVSFEITATESLNRVLGIAAGVYKGYQRLHLNDSGDYADGVPVR